MATMSQRFRPDSDDQLPGTAAEAPRWATEGSFSTLHWLPSNPSVVIAQLGTPSLMMSGMTVRS